MANCTVTEEWNFRFPPQKHFRPLSSIFVFSRRRSNGTLKFFQLSFHAPLTAVRHNLNIANL